MVLFTLGEENGGGSIKNDESISIVNNKRRKRKDKWKWTKSEIVI